MVEPRCTLPDQSGSAGTALRRQKTQIKAVRTKKHAGISRVELNRFISYSVQETGANAYARHVMSGSKNKMI